MNRDDYQALCDYLRFPPMHLWRQPQWRRDTPISAEATAKLPSLVTAEAAHATIFQWVREWAPGVRIWAALEALEMGEAVWWAGMGASEHASVFRCALDAFRRVVEIPCELTDEVREWAHQLDRAVQPIRSHGALPPQEIALAADCASILQQIIAQWPSESAPTADFAPPSEVGGFIGAILGFCVEANGAWDRRDAERAALLVQWQQRIMWRFPIATMCAIDFAFTPTDAG